MEQFSRLWQVATAWSSTRSLSSGAQLKIGAEAAVRSFWWLSTQNSVVLDMRSGLKKLFKVTPPTHLVLWRKMQKNEIFLGGNWRQKSLVSFDWDPNLQWGILCFTCYVCRILHLWGLVAGLWFFFFFNIVAFYILHLQHFMFVWVSGIWCFAFYICSILHLWESVALPWHNLLDIFTLHLHFICQNCCILHLQHFTFCGSVALPWHNLLDTFLDFPPAVARRSSGARNKDIDIGIVYLFVFQFGIFCLSVFLFFWFVCFLF